jgi:hypothetical protein
VLRVRRVFVHSGARAAAAATARAKKLDRAQGDLQRLGRGLGSRHYPTNNPSPTGSPPSCDWRVTAYLRTATGTDPATGKPTLAWHFDQQTLDAEAAATRRLVRIPGAAGRNLEGGRPDRPPHPGRRHGGSRRRVHCVLDTGADSVDTLAVYLGTLGADFTVSEPPEVVMHLRELSDRYHRATH